MPSSRLALLSAALSVALSAALVAPVAAEPVFGITTPQSLGSPALVSFDSATPGAMTIVAPVSGVVAGQTLRAIDFRPSNGLLYALSSGTTAAQLYTVNLTTGALTIVGSSFSLTGNASNTVSIDFNPVVDRLRIVTGSGQNFRLDPNTGALTQDTTITSNAAIADVAYTNNVAGALATTLYAYDYATDNLDTIGSVNGSPTSPNTGQLFVVGDSGLLSGAPEALGFDISGVTGNAYASVFDESSNAVYGFYRVNLATGAHTLIGAEAFALSDFSVRTATIRAVSEPGSAAMFAVGFASLAFVLRRRSPKPR